MGHSSDARVVTLLGTNSTYFANANVSVSDLRGIMSLDGFDHNAIAELSDSPGPDAESLEWAVGRDIARLRAISLSLTSARSERESLQAASCCWTSWRYPAGCGVRSSA